jgi:hypothetical protein
LEILGRVPSGKGKQARFRVVRQAVSEKVEKGGRVVNPTEKQKVENGGQVGGRVVVSVIRRVGEKTLLTFLVKWIKLTH